jgi:uncharacterized protein (DUF1684 family)
MKSILISVLILATVSSYGQRTYQDSLQHYIADYTAKHEVVSGKDKSNFRFFPVDERYRVVAKFVPTPDANWFSMETSGAIKKTHRVYGTIHFTLDNMPVTLNVYQSQNLLTLDEFKDYLFLPFTDLTSGEETYTAGRYLDLRMSDIVNGQVFIDFNKAYNPYCAYVSGKYNCPIPPRENRLAVEIRAGEKTFATTHADAGK